MLPALVACAAPDADFVLMVKPQFEVGKGNVGRGRRRPGSRAAAVARWPRWPRPRPAWAWAWPGSRRARCPGPSGNVEYFLWLRRGAPPLDEAALRQAIEAGPQ